MGQLLLLCSVLLPQRQVEVSCSKRCLTEGGGGAGGGEEPDGEAGLLDFSPITLESVASLDTTHAHTRAPLTGNVLRMMETLLSDSSAVVIYLLTVGCCRLSARTVLLHPY